MPSGRTKISPKSGRGLGHVTPTIFGSTVGYPTAWLLVPLLVVLSFYCFVCLSVSICPFAAIMANEDL